MLTPHILATLFDRCVAAQLRERCDDEVAGARRVLIDSAIFMDWLAKHWWADGPPEPATYPDAVSFFGTQSLARGPRWYAADDVILGYLPDTPGGCYQVPVHALMPGAMQPTPVHPEAYS